MSNPPLASRGLILSIYEGFGFLWGMEALEAIVYIKAMLNGLKNLLVAL